MTLWEIAAAVDGVNESNNSDGVPPSAPTAEEFDAAKREHGD